MKEVYVKSVFTSNNDRIYYTLTILLFFCFAKRKVTKEKATFFESLRAKKEAIRCYLKPYSPSWRWFYLYPVLLLNIANRIGYNHTFSYINRITS